VFAAAHAEANRLRGIVEAREKSGMASRYEVARAAVEVGALRARTEEARAATADRSGALAALLGIAGWQPAAIGTLAPLAMPTDLVANLEQNVQSTPLALSAARDEEAARSAVEVARRERIPVPSLNLGRTWTSDPFGAANVVGVTVELPILDSKRGPIVKALADAEAANLKKQRVTAEVFANAQRLQSVLASRLAAKGVFENEASDRVIVLKQMSEAAYQLGRASILELLDAGRARTEIDLTRIELSVSVLEAQIRLLALLGRL
jgi:cobalt-zinc-cadmium efflux system outer membrane protein